MAIVHQPGNGKRGELCNREACQKPGATWRCDAGPSPLWYCPECAELINRVNLARNPNMMVYDEGSEQIAKGLDDGRP